MLYERRRLACELRVGPPHVQGTDGGRIDRLAGARTRRGEASDRAGEWRRRRDARGRHSGRNHLPIQDRAVPEEHDRVPGQVLLPARQQRCGRLDGGRLIVDAGEVDPSHAGFERGAGKVGGLVAEAGEAKVRP